MENLISNVRNQSARAAHALPGILKNKLFLWTTVIPTALAIVYFGLIASDVYISESRFVVRSPEKETASPLGMILKGAGFSKAQDDAYAVQDYITSRDALKVLDNEFHLKQAFSAKSVDPFSRFAALDWDDSFEAFQLYYQKKVTVELDSASSIITLTTRAFTADGAYAMNRRLLDLAEDLVNKLNERARQDMIGFASAEVAEAEKKAKAAGLALASYRNQKNVIDPEKQSAIPLQQIAKLQDDLIATKSQILALTKLAKDNPQLPVLRRQEQMLEREIETETQRVAGGGDHSLAGKAAEFQRLALEKEFADKMLASAMSTLQEARNEAVRKQLYLERVVQPIKADEAMEPRRSRNIVETFAIGIVVFLVLTILIAGVREHLD